MKLSILIPVYNEEKWLGQTVSKVLAQEVPGISEKEIRLAKISLIGKYRIGLQRYSSLAYRTALDELYGTGYDAYIDYPSFIENVSAEDVAAAAEKYIDLENVSILTVVGEEG